MARLTLTLLGGFRAHLDPGAPLAFPTRKAQALLAYLVMPPGSTHSRDRLASLLWGNTMETTARTSLRQTLYGLRRTLRGADGQPLHVSGDTVFVDGDAVTVDVREFEQRVAEGTPAALSEAAALYHGSLLEGLTVSEPPFEDWLLGERERLHEMALRALGRLLGYQRAAGSRETAIQTALRLLALDVLQEPAHRALMQLYVETGRRNAALRQYQVCASSLRRELNAEPEKETKALYEEILRGRGPAVSVASSSQAVRLAEATPPTSRSVLDGERKQVTVLFADLKGSTELVASRDPEDARALIDPVLERMLDAVRRYEGTVSQVTNDGVMALFGAPLAQEDHAIRACFAALRMQEMVREYAQETHAKHGVEFELQIGVDSGEVVVRAVGGEVHMDSTAVGQTTKLAARLEELARPGSILLTRSTLELVDGYVSVAPLGPVAVKGLAKAVDVYEVTGAGPARTRLQAAVRRGLTQFVGRDAELAQLRRTQQLVSAGHGQVIAVVGEPGVGKSRLIHEFIQSAVVQGWRILEGEAVSYGTSTSYLPLIELLKGFFKVVDRQTVQDIRDKVTRTVLALDRGLESALPPLLALLDAAVDDRVWQALSPEQRRQRTLDVVGRVLLRQAREQPLIVVLEDLHWVDNETQTFLDRLVDSLGSARLLLLVSYRPEYQHTWGSKTFYSQIRLDTLPVESAAELLSALLGNDAALAPLKDLLVRRGNPGFLEETIRTLVETKALIGERGRFELTRPVQSIQVPATAQAVLAARIDRLPPDDKRLLQVASVVGSKHIPFTLLQAIAELPEPALQNGLKSLQSAEFLYETGLYPDLEYSFKHALTHEVTYGGLLRERRRALHGRIVEVLERLHQDSLGGQVERLAHHAVRGELREKAVHYLRLAGVKAAERSALTDARQWLEEALAALEELPASPATLHEGLEIRLALRLVLMQLGEVRRALERLREAEALANRLNDEQQRARVAAMVTNFHSLLGELDEAVASGTRAHAIANRLGDLRLRILATSYLEQAHYFRGEYEHVVKLATANVALVPPEWINENFGATAPPAVNDRCWLVLSLAQLGRFAEAEAHAAEAIRLAEPTQHATTVGLAHRAAGLLHLIKGDWAKARGLSEYGFTAFRSGNVVIQMPSAVAACAWALAELGETAEALDQIRLGEQVIERFATTRIVAHLAWSYQVLGRAALALGRLGHAAHLGARAVEFSPRHPGFAAHAQHLLGDIARHPEQSDWARAEAHYREALILAEPRGMQPLMAHCHFGFAAVARHLDKRNQAREHCTAAARMYRAMDMRYWLQKLEAELEAFK